MRIGYAKVSTIGQDLTESPSSCVGVLPTKLPGFRGNADLTDDPRP